MSGKPKNSFWYFLLKVLHIIISPSTTFSSGLLHANRKSTQVCDAISLFNLIYFQRPAKWMDQSVSSTIIILNGVYVHSSHLELCVLCDDYPLVRSLRSLVFWFLLNKYFYTWAAMARSACSVLDVQRWLGVGHSGGIFRKDSLWMNWTGNALNSHRDGAHALASNPTTLPQSKLILD